METGATPVLRLKNVHPRLLRVERRSRAVSENGGGHGGGGAKRFHSHHRHRTPERFPVGVEVTRLKSKKSETPHVVSYKN